MICNGTDLPKEEFKSFLIRLLGEPLIEKDEDYLCAESGLLSFQTSSESPPYFKYTCIKVPGKNQQQQATFNITYIGAQKLLVCEEMLSQYYKLIAHKKDTLDILEEALSICCNLQRHHPFPDANGRLLFFILLPVLLYQKGIWLTETLDAPWTLIDFRLPREIARQFLPLCIKRPLFNKDLNWKVALSELEHVRLLCAMGDTGAFKEAINKKPELLNISFRPTDTSLLVIAALNNHTEIVRYILMNHPNKVNQEEVNELLEYLDTCSYDTDMGNVIRDLR